MAKKDEIIEDILDNVDDHEKRLKTVENGIKQILELLQEIGGESPPQKNNQPAQSNVKQFVTALLVLYPIHHIQRKAFENSINDGINRSTKDKNYKEYVAKMKKNKLEDWYDELYQMMLLAMLELEQLERNQKINELKSHF